jgi:D-hydroxyproline dehydrogenase subunit beta
MNLITDAVVIGAGIVGSSCAHALARAGLSVHLVERSGPARGTSGACEGNLVLWDRTSVPDLQLTRLSHQRWAQLAEELQARVGIDIEYARKGSLMVIPEPAGLDAARRHCEWLGDQGVRFEWLDDDELRAAEPWLKGQVAATAYFPDDAQIEPRLATWAQVQAARQLGATLHVHQQVLDVAAHDHGVTVRTPDYEFSAGWLVVAAGVWSPEVLRPLHVDVPVRARKGQIAIVSGSPVQVRHKVMEASYVQTVASDDEHLQVANVVESTRSGSILLGSSRAVTDTFDRVVDAAVLARIAARALEFFPDLASGQIIRSYAGLRPMSPDHLPLIGPLPAYPRVLLATGHEGGGVMMAAETAEVIAHLIVGSDPPLPVEPYLPARLLPVGEGQV